MSVTVDDELLPADEMGLQTVGQVLAHLQKENRLVVQVLIDGHEPDLRRLGAVRRAPLLGHTVFIETVEPGRKALELLGEVQSQLHEADRLKSEAVDLLGKSQNVKAMEKLSGCFSTWQHAQQSLIGTARLMRIDLETVHINDQSVTDLLAEFTGHLKKIKSAVEARDFATLNKLLMNGISHTTALWHNAIQTLRRMIESL